MITLPMSPRSYRASIELKLLRIVATAFGCELVADKRRKVFTLTKKAALE